MWDSDDSPPVPKGQGARVTLTFDLDYAYNMTVPDIAELALVINKAIQPVLAETSRVFELGRYGSRSDKIEFVGVAVSPLPRKLWS